MDTTEQATLVITLVHGTFGAKSKWANMGSKFANRLIEAFPSDKVEIHRYPWSGANTQNARRLSSVKLKQQLIEQHARNPGASHFVVAHSHGGNIALYALDDNEIQNRIHGVVCINTPFITFLTRHTRNLIGALIAGIGSVGAIIMALLVVGTIAQIGGDWWSGRGLSKLDKENLLIWMPLLTLLGWLSWRLFRARQSIEHFFEKKRDEMIRRSRLPTIKNVPILCASNCSDEVFGLFSVLEGLANLPYVLMHSVIAATVLTGSTIFFLVYYFQNVPWDIAELWNNPTVPSVLQHGTNLVISPFAVIGMALLVVTLYLACLFAVAVLLNFIVRVVPVGLSISDFTNSFFVQLSFTPVPVTVQNLEYKELVLPFVFL
jgi:pimeloyl-ACP methyl ester carboxylesterase